MGEMTAADKAKDTVAKYIEEVWNNKDFAALRKRTTPSFEYRLGGQPPRNRAAMEQFVHDVHRAFPDWRVRVNAIIAEGDTVAARWTGTVTHKGIFHGIHPTGRQISVCGSNMYRLEGGRVAEEWEQMDAMGMLLQLGALPSGNES